MTAVFNALRMPLARHLHGGKPMVTVVRTRGTARKNGGKVLIVLTFQG